MRITLCLLLSLPMALAFLALSWSHSPMASLMASDPKVGAPSRIVRGMPYVIGDQFSNQVCVSSRDGHPLPPYIMPAGRLFYTLKRAQYIHAWIPFTVQDGYSTQLCISNRSGVVWLPLEQP